MPSLNDLIPPIGGFSLCVPRKREVSELYVAYASYLERMLEQTEELTPVWRDSVPDTVNLPVLEEWSDLG